ncbi:protein HGH1 homolog [Chroicocephalus ridibundus]|uniref:protein HGH1 homolog n=1 Tax=Chroicocephalus ridibundus TaxID=1192867 RepID=UPI002FDD9824
MDIGENSFMERAVGRWKRLPRAVGESPSPEGWKSRADAALRDAGWRLDSMILKIFSTLRDSLIPREQPSGRPSKPTAAMGLPVAVGPWLWPVTPAILEGAVMAAEEEAAVEAAMAELAALLAPAAGEAARAGAAEAALALSGSPAGRRLLAGRPAALSALLELAAGPGPPAARHAQACLVNVSAEPAARGPLLAALPALLGLLPGGPACGVLANLCRERGAARRVLRGLRERGCGLAPLLQALGEPRPPPQLGPLLCNLSQLPEGRRGLLDRSRCSVQRLLPFTQYKDSTVHRRGVVGALRNCCFEYEEHEWLLSEDVDVLPFLLLPLAGPEEFPEDEMERLPVDLQYLPPDKQREEEPDIRKMLLEAIMLLTATKPGRRVVREKGTYLVLRELHGWEREPDVLAACENLIQVLIGDEPGPGMENLLEVTVPEEVERELRRRDREDEERWRRERREAGGSTPSPQEPSR